MSFISILPKPKSRKKNFSIWQRWKCSFLVEEKPARCFASSRDLSMAEFILETNYPSRRKIRQTDNSPKYKSEDEFLLNILFTYTLRVTRITRLVFWCWAEEAWREIKNIFLAWNSFFNALWISSNIFTFKNVFSAKRSSTVAHPTEWSLPLYCGSNITSSKTSVSQSVQVNFVFLFFFEEAVASLDDIFK